MRTSCFISRRETSESRAAGNADADFHANVMPMRHLLAACRATAHASDRGVRGDRDRGGHPVAIAGQRGRTDDPITAYDRHKLMAENDLKAAAAHGNVCGATLRLSNVYGPGAPGSAARSRRPEPHDQGGAARRAAHCLWHRRVRARLRVRRGCRGCVPDGCGPCSTRSTAGTSSSAAGEA